MRGRIATAAGLALAALAAACASDRPAGPPMRADNAFLSPSGEPFRAAPDAPYASALWFARADADHDGHVSRSEFMADADRAFARFDANHDGVIDGFEIAAYEDKVAPEILPRITGLVAGEGMDGSLFQGRGRRGRSGGGGGEGRQRSQRARPADVALQGAGFYSWLDEPEPLSAADADLDGRVTLAEWRARSAKRFDLLAAGASDLALATLPKTPMQALIERRAAARAKRGGAPR